MFTTKVAVLAALTCTVLFTAVPVRAEKTIQLSLKQIVDRLVPGDRLRLTVVGFPELSSEQVLPLDGVLQLPLAGPVEVGGLTPGQATGRIADALRPYVRIPQVGLAIINRRPPRVSVTGEVLKPGPRALAAAPDNRPGGEYQTLSSVLMLAGGVTPNADLRNITIRRPRYESTDGADPTARTELKINLWEAIAKGDLQADQPIFDGDEVFVPTARLVPGEQRMLLASTVAPAKVTVQVAGQVNQPGPVTVAPLSGMTGAVAAAGGPNDKAENAMMLLRMNPEGKVEQKQVNFGDASGPLMDGDVIIVNKSFSSGFFDFLGQIFNPFSPFSYLFGRR